MVDSPNYNETTDGPKVGGLTEFGKVGYTSINVHYHVSFYHIINETEV